MYLKFIFILSLLLMQLSALLSQTVLSLNPLFTEQKAFLFPQAESKWALDENDTIVIKKTGDNFYLLKYGKANNPSQYEAVFIYVGNTTFLDLVPKIPDTIGSKEYRTQIQPLHSFLKIKIEKDTLWVAELNYAWFYNQLTKSKNLLEHSWREGGLLITATTIELRKFMEAHVNDSAFFIRQFSLERVHTTSNKSSISPSINPTNDAPVSFKRKCLPAFPLKDGWLGGDGDVSLVVNETEDLFLFSDSDVGQSGDTSRQQAKDHTLVSNTVGVASCMANGKYDIKYYWKDMYTTHPKPVFESFTKRYRYWINDAFMHKGCLYVLMPKIGAKTAPTPGDDIFDFSILGFSLAKVTDPINNTPDQWTPELIPFTFLDPDIYDLHSLVKDGNYLYLFTDKSRNQTILLRFPLNFIDSPKGHMEYYSTANVWKPGMDTTDMAVILPEQPGNTIRYHNDIKKWVMVCGPGFLDNRIRLRTANELTGPWSEGATVYECPELIPGTPEYRKNNFCYLGRELIQYYDKTNCTMYISYDTNNTDFSEIRLNPNIYSPKIITVSLTKYGIR
ncbi:MAG: DUF4185 domain-containing protein [Chitinophagaceae bacterium]|nr:DUF4185 domain-containing protein [Chitinophagaceae bacterium]